MQTSASGAGSASVLHWVVLNSPFSSSWPLWVSVLLPRVMTQPVKKQIKAASMEAETKAAWGRTWGEWNGQEWCGGNWVALQSSLLPGVGRSCIGDCGDLTRLMGLDPHPAALTPHGQAPNFCFFLCRTNGADTMVPISLGCEDS
jgi:hypothetical protein